MKEELLQTTTVFDPTALRIGNVIHKGTTVHQGAIKSEQGWMIRGEFNGQIEIEDGTLWIEDGAKITGRIHVKGQVFVFGQVGENEGDRETVLTCDGPLHLTATAVVFGEVRYRHLATYSGARVTCRMDTLSET